MKRAMKKITVVIMAAVMVLSVGATSTLAARQGRNYVDANGDGICDNSGRDCRYVDKDKDGICDNYEKRQSKKGHGKKCGDKACHTSRDHHARDYGRGCGRR